MKEKERGLVEKVRGHDWNTTREESVAEAEIEWFPWQPALFLDKSE